MRRVKYGCIFHAVCDCGSAGAAQEERATPATRPSGAWCFCGGSLELGETLAECAVRETLEETGLRLRNSSPSAGATLFSTSLDYPVPLTAVDAITHDSEGRLAFHYAIVNLAAAPIDPQQPLVPGDDAAAAQWVRVSQMRQLPGELAD